LLVIPDTRVLGIFNLQGLTLNAIVSLGFGMAIFSAHVLNKILKSKHFFVVEMPNYKSLPMFKT
jgi:ferrous iron transport protein B